MDSISDLNSEGYHVIISRLTSRQPFFNDLTQRLFFEYSMSSIVLTE